MLYNATNIKTIFDKKKTLEGLLIKKSKIIVSNYRGDFVSTRQSDWGIVRYGAAVKKVQKKSEKNLSVWKKVVPLQSRSFSSGIFTQRSLKRLKGKYKQVPEVVTYNFLFKRASVSLEKRGLWCILAGCKEGERWGPQQPDGCEARRRSLTKQLAKRRAKKVKDKLSNLKYTMKSLILAQDER